MGNITPHAEALIKLFSTRPRKIGCEVGVHAGETTASLLDNLPGINEYHAVDPWESYEKYNGSTYRKPGHKRLKTWSSVMQNFIDVTKPFSKKVFIHQATSVDAVSDFNDGYFDWIFIDANHDYPYIKENLEIWTPKVKMGGIVSGHDYNNGKWVGIKKAVDEFVPKDKLNVISECYVWWFERSFK